MADFHSYFSSFLPSSWVYESGTTRPGAATKQKRQSTHVESASGRVGRVVGAALVVAAASFATDASDFSFKGGRGDLTPMAFEGRLHVPDELKSEMVTGGYWQSLISAIEKMPPAAGMYIPESWA